MIYATIAFLTKSLTNSFQRITEIAGVVVSFDPKPIPVSLFKIFEF